MTGSNMYSRTALIQQLDEQKTWDILVIGGGATGLGVALDAVSRGLSTILLEQHDFAKGTSSRSTKLIHGGVRYLSQGDIKLVYSALHERDILSRNAAHVVKPQSFIIPCYSRWDIIKYSTGLKLYDLLAGSFNFGRSRILNREKIFGRLQNILMKGLKGGVEYFDGQFDDARLAVNLAQSSIERSAVVLNYFKVANILKEEGRAKGVRTIDVETNKKYLIKSKVVINATGVFVDDILKMDEPSAKKMVRPSQGVHLVIDKSFLNGASALMIPKTSDGRVLFAVPWHNHVLVGTTDTPLEENSLEPVPLDSEISFILNTVNRYLTRVPHASDVLSVFAGLRPLAASSNHKQETKELSRDHKLFTSKSGMITITGGKWTTYRKMAEETVDLALSVGGFAKVKSETKSIKLHGCMIPSGNHLSVYGTDEVKIKQLIDQDPSMGDVLVNGHAYTLAQVIWSVRQEMARTVEDVLARRLRLLFLDAKAAIEAAPRVASILSKELGWSEERKHQQLDEFYKIANQYILKR